MIVTALIIGIDGWEQYTRPFVESIQEHEPDCRIVVIDNGSDEPYPSKEYVTRIERTSYPAAINRAVEIAGEADWYLVVNNDVICNGPFATMLGRKRSICGPDLLERLDIEFIDAWLVAIPRFAWEKLGPWDENYRMSSYGGLDYCKRAHDAGVPVTELALPFTHLESGQRLTLPGFAQADMANYNYFREKHGV